MESMANITPDFWRGKRVLVTGHTGFKGTWLINLLTYFGAAVTGIALKSPTAEGDFFFKTTAEKKIRSVIADVRDLSTVKKIFAECQPEIVFHLAAQPIVLESYRDPVTTYETNVMGTVNVLECVRLNDTVQSVINVTTDKVYENLEWVWGYRETDCLNGHDPYSNSKSCSELVTASYKKSFFNARKVAVSTLRAGNVIGGGDFSPKRIIPDCVRAAINGDPIKIRNARSIRPYQHVLEPLYVYMLVAEKQFLHKDLAGSYNIGPNESDTLTTGELANMFCTIWGENITWQDTNESDAREARLLRLDCSKLQSVFNWHPHMNAKKAVAKTVEWAKIYANNGNLTEITEKQIQEFLKVGGQHGARQLT